MMVVTFVRNYDGTTFTCEVQDEQEAYRICIEECADITWLDFLSFHSHNTVV